MTDYNDRFKEKKEKEEEKSSSVMIEYFIINNSNIKRFHLRDLSDDNG